MVIFHSYVSLPEGTIGGFAIHMDVGQNGRPLMGPQMEMSSLVEQPSIILGYLILTHSHINRDEHFTTLLREVQLKLENAVFFCHQI